MPGSAELLGEGGNAGASEGILALLDGPVADAKIGPGGGGDGPGG